MRSLVDIEKDSQSAFNLVLQSTGAAPVGLPSNAVAFDTTDDTLYYWRGVQLRYIKLKSKAV